ncbi:gamma-butyrobetaine dioxygenase [Arctopsyche grandis]|uniref:gamma-butyrobetaine dioxygenase n=1 Tax=Arctopsyche grandis TaxID=121162 RepID=UPI00406D8226
MFLTKKLSSSISKAILSTAKRTNTLRRPLSDDKPTINTSQDFIHLQEKNSQHDFPHVWLRDNCQCEKCFHVESKSRIINWKYFDVNTKPSDVQLTKDNIEIKWDDGHLSTFNLKWLHERSFNKSDRKNYTENVYKLKKKQWSKNQFDSIFKKFKYDCLINENEELKRWLESLSIYGVALVTDVPSSSDSCRRLASRVEFIKRTHYGEEFEVKAKPGTTNVAYLASNLQLHTDLPYYEYKPGTNLLHCITQSNSSGGENLLCDGLHVADQIRRNKPANYQMLTDVQVEWEDYGEEDGNKFHSMYRSPVICLDKNGDVARINYSTPQRGSHLDVSVDGVKPWYESLKIFTDLIHEESAHYKMSEGEMLCFDNRRLLHGRTEYSDTDQNVRRVIGAYVDWDFINSRLRVLNNK